MKEAVQLSKNSELRLEVPASSTTSITLRSGSADVFGSELALGRRVDVSDAHLAVFTHEGASLSLEGDWDVMYCSDESPVPSYVAVNHILDNKRKQAQDSLKHQGPRVMLVGPTDSGKSTLCKFYCNLAVRQGWKPLYVDLDLGQNGLSVPGSISAVPIEAPLDVASGFPLEAPIVYYAGTITPSDNPALLMHWMQRMGEVVERRCTGSDEARSSGCVINTMGWVEGLGYEVLLAAAAALRVDVLLVIGQDRLYSQLTSHFKGQPVEVVKLLKSGGVVEHSAPVRKLARSRSVHQYFYGRQNQLSPTSTTLKFESLKIYRVAGGSTLQTAATALPLGAAQEATELRVTKVTMAGELMNTMLAVSHAKTAEELLSVSVAGLLYVTAVNAGTQELTVLSPMPGPLPGEYLLAGSGSFKIFLE